MRYFVPYNFVLCVYCFHPTSFAWAEISGWPAAANAMHKFLPHFIQIMRFWTQSRFIWNVDCIGMVCRIIIGIIIIHLIANTIITMHHCWLLINWMVHHSKVRYKVMILCQASSFCHPLAWTKLMACTSSASWACTFCSSCSSCNTIPPFASFCWLLVFASLPAVFIRRAPLSLITTSCCFSMIGFCSAGRLFRSQICLYACQTLFLKKSGTGIVTCSS